MNIYIHSYTHAHIHTCNTCTQRLNSLEWQSHRATVSDFSVMFIFVKGVNQYKCGFLGLSSALHIMHHWSFHWVTFESQRNWWLWICIILLPPTLITLDNQAKQYHSCPTQCLHTWACQQWYKTIPVINGMSLTQPSVMDYDVEE